MTMSKARHKHHTGHVCVCLCIFHVYDIIFRYIRKWTMSVPFETTPCTQHEQLRFFFAFHHPLSNRWRPASQQKSEKFVVKGSCNSACSTHLTVQWLTCIVSIKSSFHSLILWDSIFALWDKNFFFPFLSSFSKTWADKLRLKSAQ